MQDHVQDLSTCTYLFHSEDVLQLHTSENPSHVTKLKRCMLSSRLDCKSIYPLTHSFEKEATKK